MEQKFSQRITKKKDDYLLNQFRNPPLEFGPIPIWWWHREPLDKEKWQLRQLKEKVCLV